jgi:hypothetical protein
VRLVARLGLLAFATLIGVVIAEVVVRWTSPQVTMFPRYVASSEYEIELARNAAIRHAQGGRWSYTYTTNELGRRGPYLPPDAVATRRSVIVLGDSFSFGVGVEDDEVYSARLQAALGEEWWVVNGALGGWGIDSQIKWYARVGADYAPDAVVLQFTANDPYDSDSGVTSVGDDGLAFHPYPDEKPGWQVWISGSRLLQESHLFALLRSVHAQRGAAPAEGAEPDPEAVAAAERWNQQVQDRYVAFLAAFADQLADAGVPLLFVSVTHETEEAHAYDLGFYPRIQAGVDSLASLDRLRFVELPLERMGTYPFSPEGHWGPEHHVELADALTRLLVEKPGEADSAQRDPGR